ncbi:hypothetical protein [Streptomyces sp. NPDC015125]|uniref:hypothetical protein n=1 Tax=Streptomyces sp. NPDC015125 TaxID=3364938 RepID=UPI0036F4BD1B
MNRHGKTQIKTACPRVESFTGEVDRKQIRPVIQTGAVAMDGIFKANPQRWSRS